MNYCRYVVAGSGILPYHGDQVFVPIEEGLLSVFITEKQWRP